MRTTIFAAIIALSMLFVSATMWEGVTDVNALSDNPGNYSVATNAFPRNSVVDVTNLENGKMVRVLVVSGLETTGLLATLSRNAADALQLRDTSTGRIRMTLPPDDIAFAHFRLGPIESPDAAPALAETEDPYAEMVSLDTSYDGYEDTYTVMGENTAFDEPYNYLLDPQPSATAQERFGEGSPLDPQPADVYTASVDNAADYSDVPALTPFAETAAADFDNVKTSVFGEPSAAEIPVIQPSEQPPMRLSLTSGNGSGTMSIVPSQERIPSDPNQVVIAPENIVAPIQKQEAKAAETKPSASTPQAEFSPFQAPLINGMEKGKCYVQVGVYTRADHVEDEVNRIGKGYPLAIQNVGTDASPMFRVLLGPLNQGESEAMLQRFKNKGYDDAFVRYN